MTGTPHLALSPGPQDPMALRERSQAAPTAGLAVPLEEKRLRA